MPTGRVNGQSKLVSIRLPFELIDTLKALAERLGRPYQSVMKEAIAEGIPIVRTLAGKQKRIRRDSRSYKAPHLTASLARLKRK